MEKDFRLRIDLLCLKGNLNEIRDCKEIRRESVTTQRQFIYGMCNAPGSRENKKRVEIVDRYRRKFREYVKITPAYDK